MAYVKTNWIDDETAITADRMNNIENGIKNNNNYTKDTGWIKATLNSGFTHNGLATSGDFMYRRIGKTVFVKGSVKGFTTANVGFVTLPVGFRPSTRIDFMGATGGAYLVKAIVSTGGVITMTADSRGTYDANNWYAFCTSYITDNEFPNV